jgi:hypothetical protein
MEMRMLFMLDRAALTPFAPHSFPSRGPTTLSPMIAALRACCVTVPFLAMIRPFTTTDGQGNGFSIWLHSFEIFLITTISAPNSFSAPRAVHVEH